MGLPCFKSKRYTKEPKTVHIVFGFFFIINYIVGTGFLGIPYSFYEAGMLAGIVTLTVISFIAWNTATWELEVMARAQALETFRETQEKKYIADDTPPSGTHPSLLSPHTEHPKYEILLSRKFEMTELCHIFFNRWVKYLYLIIMSVYSFLAGWSYSTVAGSAWSTNLPFHTGTLHQCNDTQFHLSVAPADAECLASYRLCVLFFAVIVIPLSCMDLKEQGFVQMILGLLRFSIIISMVLYCLAKLIGDGHSQGLNNTTTAVFTLEQTADELGSSNNSDSDATFVTSFHIKGWLIAIPVFTYAQILHQGVPALTHPIRQKKLLRWFMMAVFATTSLCYMVLGIVVSLWFKSAVLETATLNWGTFLHHPSIPLRMLSYLIILFPSVDVCSAYPLVVYTIVNNLYTVFMGRDTSQKVHSYEWAIIMAMKVVFATLPIVASLFVTNLVYVLTYAGLMGFFICFFFPTALQLASEWKCKKVFGALCDSYTPRHHINNSDGTRTEESEPLLGNGTKKLRCGSPHHNPIYATPYSSRVLSHPIAVCVMGGFGFCLFVLAVASLQYPPGS